MANEFGANINAGSNQWYAVWVLLRKMQKAGYWVRASSNATTKVVSDDPTAHTILLPVNTANVGTGASITAVEVHPYGYLMTLTGLTGLVAPTVAGGNSEGCFITISGAATSANNGTWQTYEVVSATSAKVLVRTGTPVAPDASNGAISWQEKDPTHASILPNVTGYTAGMTNAAWWVCIEGMQTIQLKFAVAVTGEFLRGETVTQATSGATGECIGVVWDSISSVGWMVLLPRTGLFDAANVVTGSTSGATFTPNAMHTYRRQFVFSKSTNHYTGSAWHYIFRDTAALQVAESYSVKAANANCTATVAPGGSVTAGNRQVSSATGGSNAFYVLRCKLNQTYDGVTALVHADGIIADTVAGGVYPNGRAQISAANIMPRAGRSADGTWWVLHGNTSASPMGGNLLAMLRVDASEEGDVDLTVSFAHCTSSGISNVKRDLMRAGDVSSTCFNSNDVWYAGYWEWFRTVRVAEGTSTGTPTYAYGHCSLLLRLGTYSAAGVVMALSGTTRRMVSHPAVVSPGFKEPVGVGASFYGRYRWLYAIQQGSVYQTFEGRKYICVVPYAATVQPGFILGPWDQTSDPVQS